MFFYYRPTSQCSPSRGGGFHLKGHKAQHQAEPIIYTQDVYIFFVGEYYIDFRDASAPTLCAFIHRLTQLYPNPNTILNYVSSLSSVLRRLGVDTSGFRSMDVQDFLTSIRTNIRHTPNKRQPVLSDMLAAIVTEIGRGADGATLAFAVSIMFYTMLRQSNLAPPNKAAFDKSRHLLRRDILLRDEAVIVGVKWSKSLQGPTASSVAAPAILGSVTCPVTAYRRMTSAVPTTHYDQALLCFRDRSPMPMSYVNKMWSLALTALGIQGRQYTLHSLRRGAATEAYSGGVASIDQIKRHGHWTSDAVHAYLPTDPRNSHVFKHFQQALP